MFQKSQTLFYFTHSSYKKYLYYAFYVQNTVLDWGKYTGPCGECGLCPSEAHSLSAFLQRVLGWTS